jgi:hypothetical protein
MISPSAGSEVTPAGELVECLGQDPMFRPVVPPRAITDGMRAGASVPAAVGGPAVDPVRLEASTARPADQQAGQPVAAFAIIVWRAARAGLHGEYLLAGTLRALSAA